MPMTSVPPRYGAYTEIEASPVRINSVSVTVSVINSITFENRNVEVKLIGAIEKTANAPFIFTVK